jgi:hypothetical protein
MGFGWVAWRRLACMRIFCGEGMARLAGRTFLEVCLCVFFFFGISFSWGRVGVGWFADLCFYFRRGDGGSSGFPYGDGEEVEDELVEVGCSRLLIEIRCGCLSEMGDGGG